MPALIIGANLPDVDAACFLWLDGVEHLGFRRGITHGPPAWVLLPLVLAAILWGFDRWQTRRGKRPEGRLPVSFKWLYLLSLIGCLTHPALDWLNVYGIRLLEPFSSRWFYGDTLFIIDLFLWLLLGLATWFSLRREKRGGNWRRPARIALAVGLGYIGLNGAITYSAEHGASEGPTGNATVIASPPPLKSWDRERSCPASLSIAATSRRQGRAIHRSRLSCFGRARPSWCRRRTGPTRCTMRVSTIRVVAGGSRSRSRMAFARNLRPASAVLPLSHK